MSPENFILFSTNMHAGIVIYTFLSLLLLEKVGVCLSHSHVCMKLATAVGACHLLEVGGPTIFFGRGGVHKKGFMKKVLQ